MSKDSKSLFPANYLKECQKQIEKLANDPELLQQAMAPFLEMQKMLGNNFLPEESGDNESDDYDESYENSNNLPSYITEMQEQIEKNTKSIRKLIKKVKELDKLLKPDEDEN